MSKDIIGNIKVGTLVKTIFNDYKTTKRIEKIFKEKDGYVFRISYLKKSLKGNTDLIGELDIRQVMIENKWVDVD